MYAITHVNVFTGTTTLHDQAILVDGDTITAIVPMHEAQLPEETYSAEGLTATAGFIDLQLNGCGGVLFNIDTEKQSLDIMNQTNLKSGTTQYLPTFITSHHDKMCQAIDVVASIENKEAEGILGLHLEGPFISTAKKGAHDENHIRILDELTAHYLADNQAHISVVTLAPENTPQTVIDILHNAGITVSLGHTNATYDDLLAKNNLSMATHLYNAMTPLGSREAGTVGYIFDKKPHAGIIVDGIHSSFASVRIAHEIMGEKLFMVTDAVTPAGTDITEYDMAGIQAYVTDGKCHYADGTIAGAAITMIEGVRNLIQHVGVSREEALRMASLYPAKAMGIDDQYGKLEAGYKANITLLNDNNEVCSVFQMGAKRI
ncbi:N-acetylglucosamine-6-phosphate deacetylase [Photobacterium aphoticum]|uniref:N-acetylglucosamine-6-phosphate deacetylase n=1 Tax=Photobacterium aphoticum TaxID=754436 RepID=A0A0J1GQU5_9GAMM|nr:N-acetylglucosamine-6-phosphate deacetylase [Photobacterium aphoticum]KLV02095.1 N-acetylglucosamine-6-phosphate deacetylase [Photobacterium aphoticum]PSU60350.1 N-acetylglucosamine-6-phosphate deacetylase [Photobacterium aphoticum]GHA35133.1 N-acetylglucosamine-6-phosphate deacetylase [Photobacterium aphoticum]